MWRLALRKNSLILRGVKQGCPLSPLLFILAYDPLLTAISRLPNLKAFAFADDLALTAETVEAISPALELISLFSELSGLGINRDKSCVVSSAPLTLPSVPPSTLARGLSSRSAPSLPTLAFLLVEVSPSKTSSRALIIKPYRELVLPDPW